MSEKKDRQPQPLRCWKGLHPGYGCEQLFGDKDYNFSCQLCITCCNRIASQWGIAFGDLTFLFSAISLLQGQSFPAPHPATREQVLPLLGKMGIKWKAVPVYQPRENQMPVHDQAEPW